MVVFTDGKSTAIDSPRHLTRRHAIRLVNAAEKGQRNDTESPLGPGEVQVNSFWAPTLQAGSSYTIAVTQKVTQKDASQSTSSLTLESKQQFGVAAPQLNLPEGSIYSVYPPPGYSEEARILPHVVLSDPHLPWERALGGRQPELPDRDRNRVPWLALLLLSHDELRLPLEVLQGREGAFCRAAESLKPMQQTSTLAVRMDWASLATAGEHFAVPPVRLDPGQSPQETRGDFIFIKPSLFTRLFTPSDQGSANEYFDPSHYRFLSHVRKLNTTGMAVAGTEDVGVFSLVVGNRAGPVDKLDPTTVSVHLVSLEGISDMKRSEVREKKRVALCSLHSWSYTVLPPNRLSVPDQFVSLGETLGLLRPPRELLDAFSATMKQSEKEVHRRLYKRLLDGFSLVKHRTQTGELTLALFRGPLTPTVVPRRWKGDSDLESDLARCSNSGLDLEILDRELGIMDITYSAAWQLGRTLALADQAFSAALVRLRTSIHGHAMRTAQSMSVNNAAKSNPGVLSTDETVAGITGILEVLQEISQSEEQPDRDTSRDAQRRWHREKVAFPRLDYNAQNIRNDYAIPAATAAAALAKSTDKRTVYNEVNDPVSTDWMIVLAWVMDRLFLSGVPAHYLITDPSHLEPERLRFFHIDANWTDAMVDGALSLGNHLGEDRDRAAIKKALNDYIYHTPATVGHPPQIPNYGFYLRSDLVSMFPDLQVTTVPNPTDRAPLLRHEIITDGVMMGLFDRVPASEGLEGLIFTQPAHQQRFAVAQKLDTRSMKIDIRRQYTTDQVHDNNRGRTLETLDLTRSDPGNDIFLWGSDEDNSDFRIIQLPRYADRQYNILDTCMNPSDEVQYFKDSTATSALLSLQLSDPVYSLSVYLDPSALHPLLPPEDERETPWPRDLGRIEPSYIPRRVDEGKVHDRSEAKSEDSPIKEPPLSLAEPSFRRPNDVIPVWVETPPSYLPERPSPVQEETQFSPARAPSYICSVYSFGKDAVEIGRPNLPQDLIFSILVHHNRYSDYKLKEFRIWVPLGMPEGHDYKLLESYQGPGAFMLSNLRFNVLCKFSRKKEQPCMVLTLLPRSSRRFVNIKLVNEMSFVLTLANVNPLAISGVTESVKLQTEILYTIDGEYPRQDSFSAAIKEKV